MSHKVGFVTLLGSLILTAVVAVNYLAYGRLNPLSSPSRIYVYGRRYDASLHTVRMESDQAPGSLLISIHTLLGKRLYTQSPVGEFVPTVIYLRLRDNLFLPYALSGGP